MKEKLFTPRRMAIAAMIAALYTAISLCLAPLSFGPLNIRVAEALSMTAVFGPTGIIGVTLGCAITNAVGIVTGANIIGALDVVFGTAATLIAALMSYGLRNFRVRGLPVAATIPPVLVNAVVVGGELCFALSYAVSGHWNPALFWTNAVSVAAGQAASCCVLGLLLVMVLEKKGLAKNFARA